MIGNCLTFAIRDFIKRGGELVMSFHGGRLIPHFAVQRDEKVYDAEIVTMLFREFWYDYDVRTTNAESYNHVPVKRFLVLRRKTIQ